MPEHADICVLVNRGGSEKGVSRSSRGGASSGIIMVAGVVEEIGCFLARLSLFE